ncbi:response regulator [Halieaceae bacterium IMCC14734]|uniref:Response regulator n=1 Tax=Candidatus Litorirhabdus singularis TaxID=2518993 RepID=A0ABT3TBE6_9GAMM|nr:response regulator [Candidatus Litorirhabdus singularis]MCX2979354.1 response regulator [Candidatus Litorirhabdus singularis]
MTNSDATIRDILLVDDDEAFTAVMARGMQRQGFDVAVAHNSVQANELALTRQPSHILLDLNLPGASGLLALPELLRNAPNASIVILTGYSSIATAVEAMKLGATNYLCKPATVIEVLAAFEGQNTPARSIVPAAPLSVERLEWEHIQKILQQHEGNISATAKALGMHRRTLQRKLQKRPVRQ